MRELALTAAEYLFELSCCRYARASAIFDFQTPLADWGKGLGDTAAASFMLDRLSHQAICQSVAIAVGAPKPLCP